MNGTILSDPKAMPEQELMASGHVACPGCGAPMAVRWAAVMRGARRPWVVLPSSSSAEAEVGAMPMPTRPAV